MGFKKIDNYSNENKNIQNLAKNLSTLLKFHKLNVSQLGQVLSLPIMTIRRLLSGETTDPRISTLKLIANHFEISLDSLIGENNLGCLKHKNKPNLIPKIDWTTLEKISTIKELDLNKWLEWQAVSLKEKEVIGDQAFAIESRPSMYPRFPHGTIFIFDPSLTPKDGDIVLIKLKNNELTLRKLVIDPPEWQLHPIISGSQILHYSKKDHRIIGINLLTMLYNRKTNT